MARLASDVDMVEEVELRRVEQWGRTAPNAQQGDSFQVVLLEPLTSEARRSAPLYDGPMERLSAAVGMPTMGATPHSDGGRGAANSNVQL